MRRDALENARESTDADRIVIGDDFVMFTADLGRHPDMRAFLPVHHLIERAQRLDQLCPGYIPRSLHRANTSSRTKWSRITFGASMVSS